MNIYISGPMRRIAEFNVPAFFAAEAELREKYPDAEIFNPVQKDIDAGFAWQGTTGHEDLTKYDLGVNLREALAMDTQWISLHADAVYMLEGWSQSSGARAEKALAEALGLEVLYAKLARFEEAPDVEDARNDGYNSGYDDGTAEGYNEWDVESARDEGHSEGYELGRSDGYSDGWQEGYSAGLEEGEERGLAIAEDRNY